MSSSKLLNLGRKPLPLGVGAQQTSFRPKGKKAVQAEYVQCKNVITKCYRKFSQYRWFALVVWDSGQWHFMMNELGPQTIDNRVLSIHYNFAQKVLLEFLTKCKRVGVLSHRMRMKSSMTSSFQSVPVPGIAVQLLRAHT